jgi:RNA polymerase sigma factor (sigma-70 family)
MTPRELFLANLDTIRGIVEYVAKRHRLGAEGREELESYVRLRLIEDDYEVLRRFRGESRISTYLNVVIQRCFLDYRHQEWGRWRASAAARRLGATAMQLERLVYRDGYTFPEATRILLQSHEVHCTEEELDSLWPEIPQRLDHRVFGEDVLEASEPRAPAPEPDEIDDQRTTERAQRALQAALDALSPREQLILRLRFVDQLTIADIARTLGLPATPLYPRVRRIFRRLRRSLESQGIGRPEAVSLLRSRFRMDLDVGEEPKKIHPESV